MKLHICKEIQVGKYILIPLTHIFYTHSHNPPFQRSCGLKLQASERIFGKPPNSAGPLAANQSKYKSAAARLESRDDPCSAVSRVCC